MNNEQQALQNWLENQIKKTKCEIVECQNYGTPAKEEEVWELKYRLSYLETELDNRIYPLDI
jgi:hypothetical protein